MSLQPQLQGTSIVLRGHFNPAIFQPAWLASYDLIRRQEAEAAEIQVIHPSAAVFKVEWLQISVVEERFQATTIQEPYYEALRDLVLSVFDLLSHTPVEAMGINRDFHYRLDSLAALHSIGHRLAPKQDWEKVLDQPGMLSLTMEGKRPDELSGYIRVKVEPSTQIESGIFVEVNDHYQLAPDHESLVEASAVTRVLAERWVESVQRSLTIAENIADLGKNK